MEYTERQQHAQQQQQHEPGTGLESSLSEMALNSETGIPVVSSMDAGNGVSINTCDDDHDDGLDREKSIDTGPLELTPLVPIAVGEVETTTMMMTTTTTTATIKIPAALDTTIPSVCSRALETDTDSINNMIENGTSADKSIIPISADAPTTGQPSSSTADDEVVNVIPVTPSIVMTSSALLPSSPSTTTDADDDVAQAAVALAAVAAAASASHKSPAEAAREARAVAQSFITKQDVVGSLSSLHSSTSLTTTTTTATTSLSNKTTGTTTSIAPSSLTTVSLVAVQEELRKRRKSTASQSQSIMASSATFEALLHNDSLLQYLLLLEYYRGVDAEDAELANESNDSADQASISGKIASDACDRLESLVKRVDGAYDSIMNLLPSKKTSREQFSMNGDDDVDIAIPDLLPPCAPESGDATIAFFQACTAASEYVAEPPVPTEEPVAQQQADETAALEPPASPQSSGDRSLFSSMFGGVSKQNRGSTLFRRQSGSSNTATSSKQREIPMDLETTPTIVPKIRADEYEVRIEREMLGLTVENVLERTVVRTVAPSGPAKKAGAKVGSLIVKVNNTETKNLTHFETIDELRQSNRPLVLILRLISEESLRAAREEMGRLIKGSGFGNLMEPRTISTNEPRPLIEADIRIDAYTSMIRRRFFAAAAKNKKEEALQKVGEKLAWIVTLLAVGLEREAANSTTSNDRDSDHRHSPLHHSAKDFGDQAKSVSKVLYEYARKKLDARKVSTQQSRSKGFIQHSIDAVGRKGRKILPPPPPPPIPGNGTKSLEDAGPMNDKPLLHIGDVLQRTRTFLADTASQPAALLRGEMISFLCDVLDIDTDMELSEQEAESATAGGASTSGINDLGSAGSLLKLIVLNCTIMRSPDCRDSLLSHDYTETMHEELKRRYGPRNDFSSVDLHQLHAGNRFLAIVHRLAASRSTCARITACSLGPVLWGHLDFPHQLQLRGVITRALHDVDVMVRKATATVLHEVAELVFDPRAVPWLVLMCERAMTDPEPQLRSAAMTLTWHLAEHLPNAFLGDASQGSRYLRRLPSRDDPTFAEVYLLQCKLLPVATRLAEDRSPSVRLAVAAQCDRLCDALGAHWSSVVIDTLLALLSDADERVRCEAVLCVPRLSKIVLMSASPVDTSPSEVSILEALIPASIKLQKDSCASVRVSLASAAGDLLTLLVALQNIASDSLPPSPTERLETSAEGAKNYKRHVDERLIPMVQTLLNDSDPEVTSSALRAVTNATRSSAHHRPRHMSMASEDDSASISSHQSREKPVFLPVLSEIQVLRLLPTLAELGNSKQWRVRQSAVEIVPALLGCTQKLETRTEIAKLCIQLMEDKVDAVRKTAAECLCMGGSSLGSHGEEASAEWISSIVIPNIRRSAVHNDCKQRLLSLKMTESVLLSGACPTKWKGSYDIQDRMTDSPIRELMAIALSLVNDRIANVRLNVGRSLESVLHTFDEEELSFVREVLKSQVESEKERVGGGDRDVVYFAEKCIARTHGVIEEKNG